MKLGYKLLLSILTLTLFLGLTTTAWAADSEAQGGLLRGVVTTIAGDSLTVQSNRAEVTLLTDDETAFEVPGIKDASLADIATGDFVVIRAARSEAGPLARHVSVIPDGSLKDRTMRGIISAVDGAKFQLRTRRGQVTVNTNENTVFRIPKVEEATAADLEEKMPVIVMGQYEQEEQVFNASAVAVIPAKIVKRHMVRGKLSAIEGDTLVLTTGRETEQEQRVQTTDETTFRVPGIENATIDDLSEGDPILALGRKDENGEFAAKSVAVIRRRPRRVIVRGEVTAVSDDSLRLKTDHQGEVQIIITENTRFRIPGVQDPGLDDIAVGDRVGVVGHKDDKGNLVATGIGKLRPQQGSNN